MLQGTFALEGQGFDKKTLKMFTRKGVIEILEQRCRNAEVPKEDHRD